MGNTKNGIYEVWQLDGIPHKEPCMRTRSKQHLINYLTPRTYVPEYSLDDKIIGENSETVYLDGEKIPLEKIFRS